MFSPRGNPQARNLFGIIGYLQKQAGVEFQSRLARTERGKGRVIDDNHRALKSSMISRGLRWSGLSCRGIAFRRLLFVI